MYDEIVPIEEVIDLQTTYSILDLRLSNLIHVIVKACKRDYFNILDPKVFFHLLRDVPFTNEGKALDLCNELMRYIKQKSFSQSLKKVRRLQHLIEGDYKINGLMIIYNDNILDGILLYHLF